VRLRGRQRLTRAPRRRASRLGSPRRARARALLDEFLVSPLHRAVPIPEDLCATLTVADTCTSTCQQLDRSARDRAHRCRMPPALRRRLRGQPGQFPASFTRRMPRHRPEDCFDQQRVTNGVAEAATVSTSSTSRPEQRATPAANATLRALLLSPTARSVSGRGPAKAIFSISEQLGQLGCSLKNP